MSADSYGNVESKDYPALPMIIRETEAIALISGLYDSRSIYAILCMVF
ncbi:MAG: hypothetical protein CSYNP_01289 [Syntrophus sp. SKADARSKE-3]|nr:hypothetical protein [Syntrophus sp. SKADARSKE-3]